MTDDLQNLMAGMVKPLEWAKHPTANIWRAITIVGTYKVFGIGATSSWDFDSHFDQRDKSSTVAETVESALAAAQAHHSSRITATLNPDAVLALVAAAYADAAEAANCGCAPDMSDCLCKSGNVAFCYREGLPNIASRTPTDATAALARMLSDARADEREKAAQIAKSFDHNPQLASPNSIDRTARDIAAAIRAMKGEQG